jgi:hypothetical protein
MKLVIIESPFAGNVDANIEHSLLKGESPIASHLLMVNELSYIKTITKVEDAIKTHGRKKFNRCVKLAESTSHSVWYWLENEKPDFGIACQKCFDDEAGMQNNNGEYLCDDCYMDERR